MFAALPDIVMRKGMAGRHPRVPAEVRRQGPGKCLDVVDNLDVRDHFAAPAQSPHRLAVALPGDQVVAAVVFGAFHPYTFARACGSGSGSGGGGGGNSCVRVCCGGYGGG